MLSIIKLRLLRLREEYPIFIIMTVMALGLTFIFGLSMDGYKPTVLVVDEDKSNYSEMIIKELKTHPRFRYEMSTYKEALKRVDEGKVLTAIVIDKGFEKAIREGIKPTIGIIKVKDDRDIFALENLISTTSYKMTGNTKLSGLTADYISSLKEDTDKENIKNIAYNKAVENWKYRIPIEVDGKLIDVNNEVGYNNLKHSLIGFSVFFSMYTMVFGIGTILNDRQYNTWQRMIISPLSKAEILGGNMIVAYLMGALQFGVLILGGKYLFKIDWGSSLSGILMISGAFVFAVTCLGLFLSGIVKTHSQLGAVAPVVLTSTAMLGGCMWPLEIVNSKIILFLANFTPQKWAVQGMERIAVYGHGFEAAVMPSLILLGMGLVFFGTGVKLVKFE